MGLDGRTALVTGAASGIGAASARLLAQQGADVIVCDVDAELGARVAAEIGGRFIALDVGDPAAWESLDTEVDLLHLNAGVTSGRLPVGVEHLGQPVWDRVRRVKIEGLVNGILRFAQQMTRRQRGAVVVTSSLSGLAAYPGDPLYAATKHFSIGLVRSLAGLLEPYGVRINVICPDATNTGMTSRRQKERWADFLLDPQAVAAVAVDLLTSGSGTGEAWVVIKGRTPEPYRFPGVPGSPVAAATHKLREARA
jgi:NAD(P)-dependent dehydrogenase (short-subunit alcohol dehydrogenase family)